VSTVLLGLLLLFGPSQTAWASDVCPPTATEVQRARMAFDDAEVAEAATILEQALEDLTCQTRVVAGIDLLELYRLDGLVALSRMDDKAAVYATIRAVTVDPSAVPPVSYGPELASLHRTWADRLSGSTATVGVSGGGTVWLDGQQMTHGSTRVVLQGEHLLQVQLVADGEIASHLLEVNDDELVETGVAPPPGVPGPNMPAVAPDPMPPPRPVGPQPNPAPVPLPAPVPVPEPILPEPLDPLDPEKRARKRPAALWILAGTAVAAGGASFGWAVYQDEAFDQRPFTDPAQIDRAAQQIRVGYGAGYGLLGVGGVLLVTNTIGF
jgi:hypothetical protein